MVVLKHVCKFSDTLESNSPPLNMPCYYDLVLVNKKVIEVMLHDLGG